MDHDDAATRWRKSSYSNTGANCVEVARIRGGMVAVRDSKDPDGGMLSFSPDEWKVFTGELRTAAYSL
jgi:hypothetical protein